MSFGVVCQLGYVWNWEAGKARSCPMGHAAEFELWCIVSRRCGRHLALGVPVLPILSFLSRPVNGMVIYDMTRPNKTDKSQCSGP